MPSRPSDADLSTGDAFSTDAEELPASMSATVVELADGGAFDLEIGAVAKRLGNATLRMLAYNRSIPGPTLKVQQGSRVTVNVTNNGDHADTVHWHGLRLDNRFDGTHETQAPIEVGSSFSYVLEFPDPGVYWYHPHVREDYGQELGLYGNILVVPTDPEYWPPANREVLLTVDDVLIEDDKIAAFSSETTYAAMGRFGNVMLVGGETELTMTGRLGEVVRFYLTNTANTRVFNVGLERARMKLVGADSGRYEHEQMVERVVIAPSERAVVDVLLEQPGDVTVQHHTPQYTYSLGTITVGNERATPSLQHQFEATRTNADMAAERDRITPFLAAPPDKMLAFVAEMDMGTPEGAVVYICPMHPEVVSADEGSCPRCGMKLVATAVAAVYRCPMHPEVVSGEEGHCPHCGMKLLAVASTYACPMHQDVSSDAPGRCPECGMKLLPSQYLSGTADHGHSGAEHSAAHAHDHHEQSHADSGGIEWEDDMVEVNRITTPDNMRWKLIDPSSGSENHAIDWHFRVGDQVKIRLLNELDSDHPMHHPFHIHGAGRFLILARDDVPEPSLAWKDTVLVRTGETVDILLDVTNPGLWMAHCHIAEHHESGMMFSFNVEPKQG